MTDFRIGDKVRVTDTSALDTFTGVIESGHADDWYVRTADGELTGPWDSADVRPRATVEEKSASLRMAFPVLFAVNHHDAYRNMLCDYVGPHDTTDNAYAATEDAQPWVNLGSVASGRDAYNQTSTWQRSNFRSLMRDYPDVWTNISYSNVDGLGAYVEKLDTQLINTLIGLAHDYPIYDESDLSELESAEITDSWDEYLCADISRHYGLTDAESEVWQEYASVVPNKLLDAFWSAMQLVDYYPEHNGLDVLWDETTVARIARIAMAALTDCETATDAEILARFPAA